MYVVRKNKNAISFSHMLLFGFESAIITSGVPWTKK
jgi:hypothetical protein